MGNQDRGKPAAAACVMKNFFSLTLLLLFFLGTPAQARAEGEEIFHPQGTPLRKLERGGANALLGGLEFCYRLRQPDNGSILPPWITGIGSSIYYTCKRSLAGIYEIVTFPFPAHGAPLMNPEFVWQYPPKKK